MYSHIVCYALFTGEFRKNFDAARTEVKVGDGATATVSLASDTAPAGVTSPLGNEGARIAASPSPKQPFTTPSQDFRVTGVSMAKATKAPNELGADDAITSAALEAAVPNDFAAEVPVAAASDQGTPYAALLYKELTSLFGLPADGDGKQKLVMEFPGRVLDMQSYAYPVRDALSAMQKPQASGTVAACAHGDSSSAWLTAFACERSVLACYVHTDL